MTKPANLFSTLPPGPGTGHSLYLTFAAIKIKVCQKGKAPGGICFFYFPATCGVLAFRMRNDA
jgi:hypothetical protein